MRPSPRRRTSQAESGVASVLVIAMVAVLTLVAGIGAGADALVLAHRRVQGAADLAALAGASAAGRAEDACRAAARLAGRNGAALSACRVVGREVEVVVRIDLPLALGGRSMRARARAGPVDRWAPSSAGTTQRVPGRR